MGVCLLKRKVVIEKQKKGQTLLSVAPILVGGCCGLHCVEQSHHSYYCVEGVRFALAMHLAPFESFFLAVSQFVVVLLKGFYSPLARFVDFLCFAFHEDFVQFLAISLRKLLDVLCEGGLILEGFPSAVVVGNTGVVIVAEGLDVVAEAVSGAGGVAVESEGFAIDSCSEGLIVVLLSHCDDVFNLFDFRWICFAPL